VKFAALSTWSACDSRYWQTFRYSILINEQRTCYILWYENTFCPTTVSNRQITKSSIQSRDLAKHTHTEAAQVKLINLPTHYYRWPQTSSGFLWQHWFQHLCSVHSNVNATTLFCTRQQPHRTSLYPRARQTTNV